MPCSCRDLARRIATERGEGASSATPDPSASESCNAFCLCQAAADCDADAGGIGEHVEALKTEAENMAADSAKASKELEEVGLLLMPAAIDGLHLFRSRCLLRLLLAAADAYRRPNGQKRRC